MRRRLFTPGSAVPVFGDPLRPSSRRQRRVRAAAIAVAVAALCGYLDTFTRAFDYLEQKAYSERLRVYGARNASLAQRARERIVLVTLSDDTFDAGNRLRVPRHPAPRDYHARVIRELTRAGAKVIAFDLLFQAPRDEDEALAGAIRESRRVVLACGDRMVGDETTRLVFPNPRLRQAARYVGHTRVPPSDAERPAIDRIKPVILEGGATFPALSLQAVRVALDQQDRPIRRTPNGWRIGSLTVPVDADGTFKIRYLGAGESFPEVPYELIYNGAVDDEMFRQNRFFRDKIVLVGDTTKTMSDFQNTTQGMMAGVEVHANAIATLLQRGFIRDVPAWANITQVCLLAALMCPLASVWRLRWAVLSACLLLPAYLLLNTWLFVDHNLSLRLVAPASVIVLASFGMLTERGLTEERDKVRMRGLLRRYVSPQIADFVVDHPEKCVWGGAGEHITATVLFSDIRGFTALSERLTPEELVARMNGYFEAMTRVIFRHGGATTKFAGDGMMALFGVPVPHPDHARRAVAAAIDMQQALDELQATWRARGEIPFDIGIGINTGEMVAGSVGSPQFQEFTVYGLQVNLASRVESLNKEFGSRILITDSTYQKVKEEVAVRGPLTAPVKGFDAPALVYELFGWCGEAVEACPAAATAEVEA